jgi:hypothetical protein
MQSALRMALQPIANQKDGADDVGRCLIDHVGTDLADQRVLIGRAAAAVNSADQLAALY